MNLKNERNKAMLLEKISAWGGEYIETPQPSARRQWYHYYRMARRQHDWLRVWWLTGKGLACVKVEPNGASYL
mgnify:CR=1 FL=1